MIQILHILVISMLPIIELRGAIPFAMAAYGFSAPSAFLISVLGNLIPVFFIIPFIGKIDEFLSQKSKTWDRIFTHFVEKTRNNHQRRFELLKDFALITFVAIPLPFTGAWTAALAAYLFGIPLKKAVPLILVGLVIAGIIVTIATTGVLAFA